jgi:hypothetical protein
MCSESSAAPFVVRQREIKTVIVDSAADKNVDNRAARRMRTTAASRHVTDCR